MLDAHCHVDLYPRPTEAARDADRSGVLTIAVTNLPSAFDRSYPHALQFPRLRLALGLHPLLADEHGREMRRFEELVDKTSYIGEIGLDFGPDSPHRDLQIASLRHVLKLIKGRRKFITVHSRKAEGTLLDLLDEVSNPAVVFHWFTGNPDSATRALAHGHFFSINPAMIRSQRGKSLIESLPPERVLTESDGPFVRVSDRVCVPEDVVLVERYLARSWGMSVLATRARIRENFLGLVRKPSIRRADPLP